MPIRMGRSASTSRMLTVLGGVWVFLLLGGISFPAKAEQVRYHGFQLTEQYHLLVEERAGGILRVGLRARTRPEGGLQARYIRVEDEAETGRLEEVEYLAEVRSEVVAPSPPNYFQSRGSKYRITVQGIEKGPQFFSRRTVNASDARRALTEEFRKMWVQSEGIYQVALYWAVPIVLSVFKDTGRMPAPVYATVAQSVGGGIRTVDPTLTRRALPAGRKLGPQPGFRQTEPLTGMKRVRAEMNQPSAGTPSARAGASTYQPPKVRAGGQSFQPQFGHPSGIRSMQ
ncbi:MAG TPA: hypothetical protein PKY35_08740 [Candidatus Hydrogenedentes bacterium]|nr:hypothetical protein [Candidatus Hydrogenedentota bacterium]HOL77103.1 hypothetical protein [Candidatus Hydrogenedentota bacterium]HPO86978.1 hypothetical protein [Candidatus Hydrogenedentota bacterium]